MEQQEKEQKRRVWGCLIIAAIIVILPLVAMGMYNLGKYFQFKNRLDEYRAKGLPVTPEEGEKWNHIPSERNAAVQMDFEEWDKLYESALVDLLNHLAGRKEWDFSDFESYLTPRHANDVTIPVDKDFVRNFYVKYASDYKVILKLLEPLYQFIDKELVYDGIEVLTMYTFTSSSEGLMQVRDQALCLALRANYCLYVSHDMEGCTDSIIRIARLSEMLKSDNSLIGRLVSMAVSGIAVSAFQRALLEGGFNQGQLERLAGTFGEMYNSQNDFADVFVTERIMGIDMAERMGKGEIIGFYITGSPDAEHLYCMFVHSPFFLYTDLGWYLDLIDDMTILSTTPWPQTEELRGALSAEEHPLPFGLFTSMLSWPPMNSVQTFYKSRALEGMAAIAADIERGRLEGKSVPADLAGYPEKDPFTGKPFKIAVKGDYVYIYSLGADMKDSALWQDIGIGHNYANGSLSGSGCDEMIIRLPKK